jgi:hypothetical protein
MKRDPEFVKKCKEAGLRVETVEGRLKRGWSEEDAFNAPLCTRSEAGHRAAKASSWRKWDPHRFKSWNQSGKKK